MSDWGAIRPKAGRSGAKPPWIGLDLLDVQRLERALERRPRLAERLFTDAEREYARVRARPVQHLAARFCAKEAVAKALGLQGWSFRDVEVVATGAAPEVRLSGRVAERADQLGAAVSLSLTHTGTTAGAVALIGRAGNGPP
ncbi:MAG TPA: holo-ACP synthase [Thermoleophilaceae bacterium]|nr:holo-ACP synthase [Thermoleophilaceae bacterium]